MDHPKERYSLGYFAGLNIIINIIYFIVKKRPFRLRDVKGRCRFRSQPSYSATPTTLAPPVSTMSSTSARPLSPRPSRKSSSRSRHSYTTSMSSPNRSPSPPTQVFHRSLMPHASPTSGLFPPILWRKNEAHAQAVRHPASYLWRSRCLRRIR